MKTLLLITRLGLFVATAKAKMANDPNWDLGQMYIWILPPDSPPPGSPNTDDSDDGIDL